MDHTSNLCKILTICALSLIPLSSSAQQVQPRMISTICGEVSGLIQYLIDTEYQLVFMGDTFTPGISDSLWLNTNDEFVYVRSVQQTGEGCMVASGRTTFSKYVLGENL